MIDLRDYDQAQHGTRNQRLRVELLEPTVDEALAQRIRDEMDRQLAARCVQRYEQNVAARAAK